MHDMSVRIRVQAYVTVVACLVLVPALAAQTVDEIVAKNLAAKGGVEALKAVQAVRITAHVNPAPDVTIPVTITTARPNKLKQETNVQGQQIIMAFDGQTAWTINPMMGVATPRLIEGGELENLRTQADMDGPLVDYKAKGSTIQLVGTETVNDKKTQRLKITRKDGQSQELFVDAETGLEVKAVNQVVRQGQTFSVESVFSDYRKVGNLTMAHKIEQSIMGQNITFSIDKVEFLTQVDPQIFKMPAAPAK
jgi:outer membrane lipoprotein-sorting protein